MQEHDRVEGVGGVGRGHRVHVRGITLHAGRGAARPAGGRDTLAHDTAVHHVHVLAELGRRRAGGRTGVRVEQRLLVRGEQLTQSSRERRRRSPSAIERAIDEVVTECEHVELEGVAIGEIGGAAVGVHDPHRHRAGRLVARVEAARRCARGDGGAVGAHRHRVGFVHVGPNGVGVAVGGPLRVDEEHARTGLEAAAAQRDGLSAAEASGRRRHGGHREVWRFRRRDDGADPWGAHVDVSGGEVRAEVEGTFRDERLVADTAARAARHRLEKRREALARELAVLGRPDVGARVGTHTHLADEPQAVFTDEGRLDGNRHGVGVGHEEERVVARGRGAEAALLAIGERPLRGGRGRTGRGVSLEPGEGRRERITGHRRAPVHAAFRDDRHV